MKENNIPLSDQIIKPRIINTRVSNKRTFYFYLLLNERNLNKNILLIEASQQLIAHLSLYIVDE